jgi:hypothetical protein
MTPDDLNIIEYQTEFLDELDQPILLKDITGYIPALLVIMIAGVFFFYFAFSQLIKFIKAITSYRL